MTDHPEMDLTTFLQTEGRRLAGVDRAAPRAVVRDVQQQAGIPDTDYAPRSLTEALQRMGSEFRRGR